MNAQQPGLFDGPMARAERDKAIERVDRAADDDWREEAYSAVIATADDLASFTTDDVLARFPALEGVSEPRAWGAVMQRAKRAGYIQPGGYRNSPRVKSHARPKRVWVRTMTSNGR